MFFCRAGCIVSLAPRLAGVQTCLSCPHFSGQMIRLSRCHRSSLPVLLLYHMPLPNVQPFDLPVLDLLPLDLLLPDLLPPCVVLLLYATPLCSAVRSASC